MSAPIDDRNKPSGKNVCMAPKLLNIKIEFLTLFLNLSFWAKNEKHVGSPSVSFSYISYIYKNEAELTKPRESETMTKVLQNE